MDDAWNVERLQELPSAHEFSSRVEARNIPVVFEGSVTSWPAYTKWQPLNGGLKYLKEIASNAAVQVMLSSSDTNFYGDIRSHERMALSFGEYLDYTSRVKNFHKKDDQSAECPALDGMKLYLAQVPILSKEQESSPLEALLEDIIMPRYLNSSSIANINLWMTAVASKSSTHYDPFHNILCVIAGKKQVTLWPPTATPFLYPYPVYGEASNHSSVDFVKPDTLLHPRFERAHKDSRVVTLDAGDALFIPEGWYHQVNSEDLTIAVNLWWPSTIASMLGSHMDGYYLRRIVSSLLDSEKEQIIEQLKLHVVQAEGKKLETDAKSTSSKSTNDSRFYQSKQSLHCRKLVKKQETSNPAKEQQEQDTKISEDRRGQISIDKLTPSLKNCLHNLMMTCTAQNMVSADEKFGNIEDDLAYEQEAMVNNPKSAFNIFKQDTIAQVFSILSPLALKEVLTVMMNHFPRTLEVLVLHKLSPIAAELLTRKFDEMDKLCSEVEQAQFYKAFYGVFEDPRVPMSVLLDGKEAFASMALQSVLENYLGVLLKSP